RTTARSRQIVRRQGHRRAVPGAGRRYPKSEGEGETGVAAVRSSEAEVVLEPYMGFGRRLRKTPGGRAGLGQSLIGLGYVNFSALMIPTPRGSRAGGESGGASHRLREIAHARQPAAASVHGGPF